MTDKKCHVIAYFTLWKLAYEYNLSPYLILRFNYDITSITIDHLKVILLFLGSVSRSMRFIIVKFAINIHNLSYNTNQFEKLFQRALQLNNNTRKKRRIFGGVAFYDSVKNLYLSHIQGKPKVWIDLVHFFNGQILKN